MGPVAKSMAPPRFEMGLRSRPDWDDDFLRTDQQTRIQIALVVSFLLHLLLVVGVTVRPPDRSKLDIVNSPLMVDLVNSRTSTAPKKPDILAQANLDGGGNTDAERRAKSPLPITKRQEQDPDINTQRRSDEPREQETRRVMTQEREQAPAVAQPEDKSSADPQPVPLTALTYADHLVNLKREELQLQAKISRDMDAYQKRPRLKSIHGPRAKEFRFTRYIEDWRTKIERVGELNYPSAARGIYGTLEVSVEIRADGTLERVDITRTSGKKVLDEAAKRIVQMAAPFSKFPPEIAQDTDILNITRTWTFTRADQFQAE